MPRTTTKKEFSWDDVYRRRRDLSKQVAHELGISSFGLTAGIKEDFSLPYSSDEEFWADRQLWSIPFMIVGQRMYALAEQYRLHYHIIDHAWWLIADDRGGEPWGFVTEPYITMEDAEQIVGPLNMQMQDFGITIKVWPTEKSPWNPNSTTPIVTTIASGMLREALRFGLQAVLEDLDWRACAS
jgi:hypothetical protein